jgi:hypothetical protein
VVADPVPYSIGVIVHCPAHKPDHPTIALLPILLSALTHSGVSHTSIYIEYISSLSSLTYTTLKLTTHVDGILLFSINFTNPEPVSVSVSPQDHATPLLETLQQISKTKSYPGIVPGFVFCADTPEAVLEMKGVMRHVMQDWVTHLLAILEMASEPIEMMKMEDDAATAAVGEGTAENEETLSELSDFTNLTVTTSNDIAAGLQTSAQQQSRAKDLLGSRKKKGTGGGSTIVLG